MTSTTTISSNELRQLRSENPSLRVLDVRTGGEFESAHIPGSVNVPLDSLGEHVVAFAELDDPVVLVCQSGARANRAQGQLSAAGKGGVHILEGGLQAWQAAGGDVAHGDTSRWAMDRQVRLVAGSMALGAVLVSAFVPKAKWLAAGVAGGLVFSAVSNTCAMANVLGRLPYNRTDCDIEAALDELRAEAA